MGLGLGPALPASFRVSVAWLGLMEEQTGGLGPCLLTSLLCVVSGCAFSGSLGSRVHEVTTQEDYQVVPLGRTCVGKVKEVGGRAWSVKQP